MSAQHAIKDLQKFVREMKTDRGAGWLKHKDLRKLVTDQSGLLAHDPVMRGALIEQTIKNIHDAHPADYEAAKGMAERTLKAFYAMSGTKALEMSSYDHELAGKRRVTVKVGKADQQRAKAHLIDALLAKPALLDDIDVKLLKTDD